MNQGRQIRGLLALAVLLIGSSGMARTQLEKGDWLLDDSHPGQKNVGECTAITAAYLNDDVFNLEVTLDKSGSRPLEVLIRPQNGKSQVLAFVSESDPVFNFQKLPRQTSGDVYWFVPTGTDDLMSTLKELEQLHFEALGGIGGVLPFSLSGSTAVLNAMRETCVGDKTLFVTKPFETQFLPKNIKHLNIQKITAAGAGAARAVLPRAVVAYRQVLQVQAELAALEARYAQWTNERNQLISTIENLQEQIVDLGNERDLSQRKIDNATLEIADLKNKISIKEQELTVARANAAAAAAEMAPLLPEHDRLVAVKRSAESRQDSAQNELERVDDQIANRVAQIASLNREATDRTEDLRQLQNQSQQARWESQRAEQEYRNFDPQLELRRRLDGDFRLRDLRRQIDELEHRARQQEGQVQQDQGAVQSLEQALRQCLATDMPMSQGQLQFRDNGGDFTIGRGGPGAPGGGGKGSGPGNPGGPGHPGGPGGPGGPRPTPTPEPPPNPPPVVRPTPEPPPRRDCSQLQNQLEQARRRLNDDTRTLGQTRDAQRRLREEAEMIRRRTEAEVQSIAIDLQRRAEQARQRVYDIDNQMSVTQNRIAMIYQVDLPRTQNELSQLRDRRPSVVDRLNQARQDVVTATNDLKRYNTAVRFDEIQGKADQTALVVAQLEAILRSHRQGVVDREQLIRQQTTRRDQMIAQLKATQATLVQKQTRLAEVQNLLVPYDSEKAAVVSKLNDKKDGLGILTQEFAADLLL